MVKLTDTAMAVLKERYFINGETEWKHLVHRVADYFAEGDKEGAEEYESFYEGMLNLDWLPNSPVLMNAGTGIKAYSACYVLPIEDNIESIYKFYSDAALISKSGGGVGANYSSIRGMGSVVDSTGGVASGPLSFIRVQDVSTDTIKQGGRRRGANMGILMCDHPDIWKFISAKDTAGEYENFNFSVGITDEFMYRAADIEYAKEYALWDEIIRRAHASAEPGVLFMDTIERGNTVPHLGKLEATNPCGEQPLLPYESCSLASINLSNHVLYSTVTSEIGSHGTVLVDWEKLRISVHNVVLFMNRVLDKSEMPIPEAQAAMEQTRKIGIGIMGLHDMLIQLGLAYDSEEGRELAQDVMAFVANACERASESIGAVDGHFNGDDGTLKRRNANLTTIAPTGTLSMVADCSSGCEPYYAPVTYKTVLDGTTFEMPNKWLPVFMKENLEAGRSWDYNVTAAGKALYKGAEDIHWRDHILMQACLQKWVDSSISKTINMPADTTVEEVKEAYELAWKEGLKGVTIYVDGSRGVAVLSSSKSVDTVESKQTLESNCTKAPTQDQLHAVRYRVKVKKETVYIIVCEDSNGAPQEVFAKFPYAQDSDWDSLCRSLSLSLRYGIPLLAVISQLEKSVRVLNDTPSHLARILKGYIKEKGIKCSECGGKVVFTGGCEECLSCGLSKCG